MGRPKKENQEKQSVTVPDVIETQEQADALADTYDSLKGKIVCVVSDKNVFEGELYARKYASRKKLEVFICKVSE